MKIIGIETSCDETAISVIEATGDIQKPNFKILSHLIASQITLHAEWGGVVPSLAKREHTKNILPLLQQSLIETNLEKKVERTLTQAEISELEQIFIHEPGLVEEFTNFVAKIGKPEVEAIAVTIGPGLEPALWVGINLARALSLIWQIPVMPINHMEGHIVSTLLTNQKSITFPAIALLISGGHTELVLMADWFDYKVVGQTRDDAVGEAFDKVARLLGLPYPGGPEIAKLAETASGDPNLTLPRPMLNSPNLDFSFSGLKTAVLYKVKDRELSLAEKANLAREFQEAVTEVIIKKTFKALDQYQAKTLMVGGGVIANQKIRQAIEQKIDIENSDIKFLFPNKELSTDNATMIAMAGFLHLISPSNSELNPPFSANGNLSLNATK